MVDVLRVRTPLITATRLPPGEHRDAGLRRGTQPPLSSELPPSLPNIYLSSSRCAQPVYYNCHARRTAERAALFPLLPPKFCSNADLCHASIMAALIRAGYARTSFK